MGKIPIESEEDIFEGEKYVRKSLEMEGAGVMESRQLT